MPTSHRTAEFRAKALRILRGNLLLTLDNDREIKVPLALYPRLAAAAPRDLLNYTLSPDGRGIHWPALDEDLTVEGIILGRPAASPAPSDLGLVLRAARLHARMTQGQLGEAIGYSQSTVSLSEAHPPRIPVLPHYVSLVLKACGLPKGWEPEDTTLDLSGSRRVIPLRQSRSETHVVIRPLKTARKTAEESILAPAASAKPGRLPGHQVVRSSKVAAHRKTAAAPRKARTAGAPKSRKTKA